MVFLCLFGAINSQTNLSKYSSLLQIISIVENSSERSSQAGHNAKVLGSVRRVGEISSGRKHETLKC